MTIERTDDSVTAMDLQAFVADTTLHQSFLGTGVATLAPTGEIPVRVMLVLDMSLSDALELVEVAGRAVVGPQVFHIAARVSWGPEA